MDQELSEQNERLPLLEASALNPDQRELYERLESGMLAWAKASGFAAEGPEGTLLGPFNALLYSPELGAAQLNYLKTERDATSLDARVREVVILTVGAAFDSKYELYAHRAVAVKAGLAAADIDALATGGEPVSLRPEELTAHRFVRALTTEHRVSSDLYAEAKAAFGHKGLVDLLHLVGLYMTTAVLLNAFEVPVPA